MTYPRVETMVDQIPENSTFDPTEILDKGPFLRLLTDKTAQAATHKTNLTLMMLDFSVNTEEALKSALQMVKEKSAGIVESGKIGIILPKLDMDTSLATAVLLLNTISALLSRKGGFVPTIGVAFYDRSDKGSTNFLYSRAFDALSKAQKGDKNIAVVLTPKQKISLNGLREDIRAQIIV